MATDPNQSPSLLPEIGPDGLPRENSVIAYTEKIIEAEQLQLRKYIEENYSKIRDVERELSNLTLEMKLTAGPKKAALEHLRKKIELSTEKIRLAKLKEEEAQKAWESASKDVKDEEALKQKLCEDLNNLVQESSSSQFARLEELKRRLEALNPSRESNYGTNSTGTAQNGVIPDISSSSPSTVGPTGNELNQENAKLANGQSQQPNNSEVVGKLGKKKIMIQNKVKGIGTIPKGRGSSAPGWTGAGFDVEART